MFRLCVIVCVCVCVCMCVLRVDGTWHADGARVGDAQQTRQCVCVCYGPTGRGTRTCVLTGYGDEAREHGTRARTRERREGATHK